MGVAMTSRAGPEGTAELQPLLARYLVRLENREVDHKTLANRSRPVKWCTTPATSSSPDTYAAAAIAITSSGTSPGSVSAFAIDSALM